MVLGINSQRAVCLLGTVCLLGCRTPVVPVGTTVKPGLPGQGTRPVQVPNGGGNLTTPTANGLIANGGGNLTTPTANGLIANGGGNLTTPTANGLIANGGGNFITPAGNGLIANGGGNLATPTGTAGVASEMGISGNLPSVAENDSGGVNVLSGELVAPSGLTAAPGQLLTAFTLLAEGDAAVAQKALAGAQVQVEAFVGEREGTTDIQPLRAVTDAKGAFRITVPDSTPRLVTALLRDATGASIRYRGIFKPGKPGKLDAASHCVTTTLLARPNLGLELKDVLLKPLEAAIQALRPNLFAQGLPLWRDETAVVSYVRNKALTLPSLKDFLAAYGEATAASSLRLSQR